MTILASGENRPGYIYLIRCLSTGRIYVGSSVNGRRRMNMHLSALRRNAHYNRRLQRSFNKYGEHDMQFEIVETVPDLNFLHAREQFWIWRFTGKILNTAPVAGSNLGIKRSPKFCARTSQRMTGNTLRTGMKMPITAKTAISQSLQGNSRRTGKAHSPEDRAKIGASLRAAYENGKHRRIPAAIAAQNLAAFNAQIASGERAVPWAKPERNAALLAFHAATGSLAKTAAEFGITSSSAWEIVKKYNPSQLKTRTKK